MILKMAREGKWNGRFAPYGYRLENGELVIAENEVEIIQMIFNRYIHTNDNLDVTDTHYDKKISDLQRRLDAQYDKIDEVEETMTELKSQIYKLKKNRYRSLNKARKDYEYTQIVGDVNALSAFKNETCHGQ